jgi:hypothetical protein
MRSSTSWRKWRKRPLDRPGGRVAEAADGVAFDLGGDVEQQVDLGHLGFAGDHPLHDPPHPAGAFAARRALTAALVLVEIGRARDGADQVGVLVHDDHGAGAEAGTPRLQVLVGHERFFALLGRDHADRDAARDHRLQVAPAAADAAEMVLDQLLHRDADRILDDAGLVQVARAREQLGAGGLLGAELGEPVGAADAGSCRRPRWSRRC